MLRGCSIAMHQRGVAIITALLIVAIVATIGVKLATHLQLDVRRTGNIISNEQALVFVSGAEELAKFGLKLDRENNTTDHYQEDWALEQTFPFEGGTLKGKLTDLQGCFNINSLFVNNAVNITARTRFQKMLSDQRINADVVDAVIDWLDSDVNTTLPNGAEDGYYMNLEKPYRTANQPMQSVSELRLVKGFEDPGVFNKIAPGLCAFGVATAIGINVNTAPAEVLSSLAPDMTLQQAEQIIPSEEQPPYTDVADMISRNNLSKVITNLEQLSVASDYFLLTTEVIIGQSRVQAYSILARAGGGETRVLMHSIGAY